MGQHSRVGAAVPAAADGGVRRLRRARRHPGRQGDRRTGPAGHPRQHDRLLHLRRQRFERRGPERQHQRAAGAEPDPQHDPAADRGAEQARRSGCARRTQGRQHVSRRLGMGRRHAVPAHQADRLALRRHAQSAGDLLAGAYQAGQDAAPAVPPRQRHRADDLRHPRHQAAEGGGRLRAGSDRRRQHGLHASPTPRRPAASTPSTSTTTAAAASTRTAGTPAPSAR